MKRLLSLIPTLVLACAPSAPGAVIITQYYEGSSNNKWLELTNVGTTTEDLSTLTLTLWQNANTEAWRTGGTASQALALSGTLAAGATLLLSHALAVLPSYAAADVTNSTLINFNGDDSIVLYSGAVDLANIIDALTFTDAGNEGGDTSIVRAALGTGYSLTAGSTYEDFPGIWQNFSNAAVDGAAVGANERLGVSTVPEPAFALLSGLGLLALLRRRR